MSVFSPFRGRNFSLYFSGQVVSNTGTWFQNLALQLVVLQATGSAQALSGVTIAQFLPLFVLSVPAGRLADRVRPRSILIVTSLLATICVGGLAVAVLTTPPDLRVLYALVAALGTVQAFERIAAQAIIFELAGPERLSGAVSLSTISLAAARSIGPGLAGVAFQAFGPSVCMLLNAASFLLVFVSVVLIRPRTLHVRTRPVGEAPVPVTSFLRDRGISTLLIVNILVALFAMNLGLVMTSTVDLSYGGDAASIGAVHAFNAVGAIAGGLIAAARPSITVRSLALASAAFGLSLAVNAAAPSLIWFLVAAPLLGLGVGYYQGVLNAAAQASVPPASIGRLMSLVTLGNYGMIPFGALLMGWVIDASSGRVSLLIGGAAALACGAFVFFRLRRDKRA